MKNTFEVTGKLTIVKRLKLSLNGNPRYLLAIDGIECKTAVDSSFGYSVTNYDGKQVVATIGTHYNALTLNSIELA